MLLYIVRHGEPNYVTDTLTERGKIQAEAVGKRIAASKIDRIFSSPLGRARETAEPACRLLGLEPEILEWAREVGEERLTPYPDGVRKSVSSLQNTELLSDGDRYLPYERALEAKGINQTDMKSAVEYIESNGREFLERMGYREENGIYRITRPNDERIALFCHTVLGRVWISCMLRIPLQIMWSSFQMTHSGVTVIEFKNNENGVTAPKCLCFSDMAHLYAEGLDMRHDNKIEI